MKKSTNIDLGVLIAIVFAAVVISGSLVFFGLQMSGASTGAGMSDADFDVRVDAAIERYVQKKQQEMEQDQAEAAAKQAEKSKDQAKNVPEVSQSQDHIYGEKDAKISLIEYSDFQCSFCRRFHATAKEVVEKYDGKVNWVYRHYPLGFHDPAATRQAIASECVAEIGGNDSFWEFGDLLFQKGASDETALIAVAKDMGIDESAFSECLTSDKYTAKVAQQMVDGTASGVTGTPGNIVLNNETGEAVLVEGAQPTAVFEKIIDDMNI